MLQGKIIDSISGKPVTYATVELTDNNGVYLGFGTSADVQGNFNLVTNFLKPGTFLKVSSIGYKTKSFPFEDYQNRNIFSVEPVAVDLPGIVITADKKEDYTKYALFAIAGLIAYKILKSR